MNNPTNNGQGGIPCPHCNTRIPTSMQELVTATKIVCPICRLELWIDRKSSEKAIMAMNKVLEAQKNLEGHKRDKKISPSNGYRMSFSFIKNC